jgi:uncharacterized protein YecE (DUF72 family)
MTDLSIRDRREGIHIITGVAVRAGAVAPDARVAEVSCPGRADLPTLTAAAAAHTMNPMGRSLFDTDETPPLAARLAPTLRALADRGVFLGTSSWKYPGWLGSVYSPERYDTKGKFSKAKFEATCLAEYAETFPTVGGDFTFYRTPTPDHWDRVFAGTPPDFTFGLKVPEEFTVLTWPTHPRYGARGGLRNDHFLDAALFQTAFLRPLEPHRDRVAVLMFEFGAFSRDEFSRPADFFAELDAFLGALPQGWRYAVEIRNKEYLAPGYFRVLARHNVAHVFNAWTRMPTLAEQFAIPEAYTADFTVVRALLQHGCTYERAVALFEPYAETKRPDGPTRDALTRHAEQAISKRRRAYVFVNNRLEGNAPATIEAVASAVQTT